jgi:CDP-glucose 4,6-dehydratase
MEPPGTALGSRDARAAVSDYWRERRVLITGATGIVGSWLAKELAGRGAFVSALVLDEDPQSDFFTSGTSSGCSIVRGNLASFADCARAINVTESQVIFHLGAQTLVGAALRDPLETFESNVRGTYNLLEAARRLREIVGAVVVASSDKAYGDTNGIAYTESMPLNGRHPYDVSKSCADLLAATYAHTYGLPVGIARCGNIYGGGDLNWSRIVPGTIRSLLGGTRPVLRSDGTLVRDYIYVRDVVSAYLSVAEALVDGRLYGEAFNFSNESRLSVVEMVRRIGALMGVDADPVVLDEARFEIPAQTLRATKAHDVLDWSARWSVDAGLADTIEWYRDHFQRTTTERVHALR